MNTRWRSPSCVNHAHAEHLYALTIPFYLSSSVLNSGFSSIGYRFSNVAYKLLNWKKVDRTLWSQQSLRNPPCQRMRICQLYGSKNVSSIEAFYAKWTFHSHWALFLYDPIKLEPSKIVFNKWDYKHHSTIALRRIMRSLVFRLKYKRPILGDQPKPQPVVNKDFRWISYGICLISWEICLLLRFQVDFMLNSWKQLIQRGSVTFLWALIESSQKVFTHVFTHVH